MKKLYLIVPYFHKTVICTWNEVWFVAPTVVINAVHTFFMSLQSEVWWRGAQLPHLQRATASASQYGALLFRRQLHHTPDRSYKCQSRGTGLKKAHFFHPLVFVFSHFPWISRGQSHYSILWKMPISRLYPQRLWLNGSTMKPRNLGFFNRHPRCLDFEKHYFKGRKWLHERFNIKLMKVDLVGRIKRRKLLLSQKIKSMEK